MSAFFSHEKFDAIQGVCSAANPIISEISSVSFFIYLLFTAVFFFRPSPARIRARVLAGLKVQTRLVAYLILFTRKNRVNYGVSLLRIGTINRPALALFGKWMKFCFFKKQLLHLLTLFLWFPPIKKGNSRRCHFPENCST